MIRMKLYLHEQLVNPICLQATVSALSEREDMENHGFITILQVPLSSG